MAGLAMPEAIVLLMAITFLAWLAFMVTFRTEAFRQILADMAERRKRRRETMVRVFGGAAKAGLTVFKLIRR